MKIQITIVRAPHVHPERLAPAIAAALAESGAVLEKEVGSRTPQGVGGAGSGLRASWFSELREGPFKSELVFGSSLAYAIPVEFGRRPGQRMPPIQALIPWVEKFLTLKEGETVEGVAFVIARSIARKGTFGAHMAYQGAEAALPQIERVFAEHVGEVSAQLITND